MKIPNECLLAVFAAMNATGVCASDPDGLPIWFDLSTDATLKTAAAPLPRKIVPEVDAIDAKYAAAVCVKNGEKLVAMGDSITEEGPGHWTARPGYVSFVRKGLEIAGVKAEIVNRGISGQRVEHMLDRLEKDVIQAGAKKLTLFGGTNNAWRDTPDGKFYTTFTNSYLQILDRCAAKGIEVFPITITPITENPDSKENARIVKYNTFVRAETKKRGLKLVEASQPVRKKIDELTPQAAEDKKGKTVTWDGVHLNFEGRQIVAWEILKTFGVSDDLKDRIFKTWETMIPRPPAPRTELETTLPDGRFAYVMESPKINETPLKGSLAVWVGPKASVKRGSQRGAYAVKLVNAKAGYHARTLVADGGKLVLAADRTDGKGDDKNPESIQVKFDPAVTDAMLAKRAAAGRDARDENGHPLWVDVSKGGWNRGAYDKADTNRFSIVCYGGAKSYESHPTTALLDDDKTMFCFWNGGHVGFAGAVAKSTDAGRTWQRIDDKMPPELKTFRDCPVVYRLEGPDGKQRLWTFCGWFKDRNDSANAMPRILSEDDGETWRNMPQLGEKFRCVISFNSIARLKDGSYMGIYHRGPNACNDGRPLELLATVTQDGGFTWNDPVVIARDPAFSLCEPCVFRSPDGKELCCLIRENNRRGRSKMIFSSDEGKTWSDIKDTPLELTGDRHAALTLPDGRVLVVFRDVVRTSPTYAHVAAWIGPYGSIKDGTGKGGYKVKLVHNHGGRQWDCGYQGIHLRKNGEVVVTTYANYDWTPAGKPSIISMRFRVEETDRLLAAQVAAAADDAKTMEAAKQGKDNNVDHVIGKISESEKYEYLHPRFVKAFDFLKRKDLAELPLGDYVLEPGLDWGGRAAVRAMVQEVDLKPFAGETQRAEAHGQYIDIQMPISGEETFGLVTLDPKTPAFKFDQRNDIGFLDLKTEPVTVKPGEFAIFFPPCGAHAPCLSANGPRKIKKVVIKIRND